jgi:hypothetical protein
MRRILIPLIFSAGAVCAHENPMLNIRQGARGLMSEYIFNNVQPRCAPNNTCDLEKIIFRKRNFESTIEEDGLRIVGTEMFIGMVARDIPTLKKYYFVQFTRGCMWDSYLNDDGSILTEFGVLRNFQGLQRIQHVIPRWAVDSVDTDPVYGSGGEGSSRHYFLQTTDSIPEDIPLSQGKLMGEEDPTIPFAYITDSPGPATYYQPLKWAKNMSLEYRVCLFRAGDVPVDGVGLDVQNAIACFEWESKNVFDHTTLKFATGGEIHKECRRPFNAGEKRFHLLQTEPAVEEKK